ncbi:MAG: DAK2 domain-containing protein [Oscillospiraceae bacterium]|nr:DAK2 domain-containing protein [Oscillospiraceae bacterium]
MIQSITGAQFKAMFISAAAAIENARQTVNELNVFPVPDGDTGINMSLTMNTAVAELQKDSRAEGAGAAAERAAGGLLRGARGNSGVILSLLFRGFSRHIKALDTIDGADFALALSDGVDSAYRAVMKPAEGTILTVSRVSAQRAREAALDNSSLEHVLERTIEAAAAALEETVEQNPVLKKAGVIDAGGKGYCIILEGMLAALRGAAVTVSSGNEAVPKTRANFSEYTSGDIRFAYCTEFIVDREPKAGGRDPIKLRALLESMGDSLVFVDDEAIIKVHVHTNNPGKAVEAALEYGPLTAIKIENMRAQHTETVVRQEETRLPPEDRDTPAGPVIAEPETRYGFVSVCSGDGVEAVMRDLGVTSVVRGGQTMNPSTEDILRAVNATPSEVVFVLPNNKNIIMAAEQCAKLTPKEVCVLPSRSVPQGIAALLAFDAALGTGENREAMLGAMSAVATGLITYAARDSAFDGANIAQGDYMALLDGRLLYTNKSLPRTLTRLAEEMAKKEPSYITVFYGEDVSGEDASAASELMSRCCPLAEVTLLPGGQPVYSYVISAE